MSDGYLRFANSAVGKKICRGLGLPVPPLLRRAGGHPEAVVDNILVASAGDPAGTNSSTAFKATTAAIATALSDATLDQTGAATGSYNGLVYDASTIRCSSDLKQLYQFFNQHLHQLMANGRIVLIGLTADGSNNPRHATAQRSLQGFIKALAKEVGRKGITANLIYVMPDSGPAIAAPLRFFMSARCAYVDGQIVTVRTAQITSQVTNRSWSRPLAGKTALVTGAARGIGAAIATVLARDGAKVIGLDVPQSQHQLQRTMAGIGGEALLVNVTDPDAPQVLARYIEQSHQAIDIIVHNAGITRDKTLARMSHQQWDLLMDINLSSIERINDHLLDNNLINQGGRIIGVSSISGIAGNAGQTNYATSKAGVIGMINSMAPLLASRQITINAVAPGFIETEMTAAMPFLPRQFGRRLCSLSQGGLPVDVAETIAFLVAPQAQGITANLIRVCGQNIMGA